jgi:hypothetical protein
LFGRDFRADVLGRAAQREPPRVLELLGEAATMRIVAPVADEPGLWRFGHTLVRETLVEA